MKRLSKIAIALALAGGSSGLIFHWQITKNQTEQIALLHSLKGIDISKIVISNDSGPVLNSVTDQVALSDFAKAANTIEPYSPNHPNYVKSFYVELYLASGQKSAFEFHTMQTDQTVYADFVRRAGFLTWYGGNCKSTALFDWMKEQMPADSRINE